MDYAQSIRLKQCWNNKIKPELRKNITNKKRELELNDGKLKINMERVEYYEAETKEKQVKDGYDNEKEIVEEFKLRIKVAKKDICCLSYIYNNDYDNAVKYFEEYKEVAYEIVDKAALFSNEMRIVSHDETTHSIHSKEDAYNQVCLDLKNTINYQERLIKILSLILCEGKDQMRAARKMNKRKKNKNKK